MVLSPRGMLASLWQLSMNHVDGRDRLVEQILSFIERVEDLGVLSGIAEMHSNAVKMAHEFLSWFWGSLLPEFCDH